MSSRLEKLYEDIAGVARKHPVARGAARLAGISPLATAVTAGRAAFQPGGGGLNRIGGDISGAATSAVEAGRGAVDFLREGPPAVQSVAQQSAVPQPQAVENGNFPPEDLQERLRLLGEAGVAPSEVQRPEGTFDVNDAGRAFEQVTTPVADPLIEGREGILDRAAREGRREITTPSGGRLFVDPSRSSQIEDRLSSLGDAESRVPRPTQRDANLRNLVDGSFAAETNADRAFSRLSKEDKSDLRRGGVNKSNFTQHFQDKIAARRTGPDAKKAQKRLTEFDKRVAVLDKQDAVHAGRDHEVALKEIDADKREFDADTKRREKGQTAAQKQALQEQIDIGRGPINDFKHRATFSAMMRDNARSIAEGDGEEFFSKVNRAHIASFSNTDVGKERIASLIAELRGAGLDREDLNDALGSELDIIANNIRRGLRSKSEEATRL